MADPYLALPVADQDTLKPYDMNASPGKVTQADEAAVDGNSAVQAGLELWHGSLLADCIKIIQARELQSEAQAPIGGLQLTDEQRIEGGGLPQEPDEDCSGLRHMYTSVMVQALRMNVQQDAHMYECESLDPAATFMARSSAMNMSCKDIFSK